MPQQTARTNPAALRKRTEESEEREEANEKDKAMDDTCPCRCAVPVDRSLRRERRTLRDPDTCTDRSPLAYESPGTDADSAAYSGAYSGADPGTDPRYLGLYGALEI